MFNCGWSNVRFLPKTDIAIEVQDSMRAKRSEKVSEQSLDRSLERVLIGVKDSGNDFDPR